MNHFTPPATRKLLSKASLCVTLETALLFTHSMRRVFVSGSDCALGVTLLGFYYPLLGRLTTAIGENGSLKLIGYLNKEGLCSNLHLIAVMLESKMLLLIIYLTLVLLLVTNLPIRDRNTTASANFAPIVKEPAMYFFEKCAY